MNLKSTLLALMLVVPVSVFSADHYVTVNGAGDKGGSNWDNAMSFETFYNSTTINNYDTGDTFYFAGGKYVFPSVIGIKKGYNFIGGFSPELTGTENTLPTYPSATPTIFSGNKQLPRILAITTPSTDNEPFKIQGIEFTEAYNAYYTSTQGALWFRERKNVEVKNCKFYGNESTATTSNGFGGMALTSEYSTIKVIDCEFYDNRATSRGGAIRLSDSAKKNGFTTIERCKIYNNNVTKNFGSAICVQYAQALNIVNTTIAGNTAGEGGEAIYIGEPDNTYKRVLNIISSTIVNNAGGNQIKMVKGNIANSIIVGCADATANATDAIAITSGEAAIVSGGYNLLGKCSFNTANSDCVIEGGAYSLLFGENIMENGVLIPTNAPNGATEDELNAAIVGWGLEGIDLTVDVNGDKRGLTVPGAVKADALPTTIKVGDAKVATYYNNVYGYTMPEGLTGYTITGTSGNKIVVNAKYQAGANVPKGAALLIAGEPNEYAFAFKLAETDNQDNLLKGTQEDKYVTAETGKCIYKLANDTERGLGFYWGSPDGKTLNNKANKCYLELDETTASAKPYFIIDTITGISNVDADKPADDGFYYTLSGIRVANPRGGIYIKNGKKVIIK